VRFVIADGSAHLGGRLDIGDVRTQRAPRPHRPRPRRVGVANSHRVLVGRHAALFDRASAVALRWLYRSVAQQVSASVPPGGSVLDIGAGPGHLLVEIGRRRPDVRIVGVDPSADMVGHAERRTIEASLHERVEVRVGAAESLPFGGESFDAVVSTLSAHHWADVAAAVREQVRVVRTNGSIWVFDLRRPPVREVARRLQAEESLAIGPARLGRIASMVLVGYRAQRE